MQISLECAGPQRHSGESPVSVHCAVLKIEMFFPIPSSIASSLVEASHLVKDLKTNSSIKMHVRHSLCCVSLLLEVTLHPYSIVAC